MEPPCRACTVTVPQNPTNQRPDELLHASTQAQIGIGIFQRGENSEKKASGESEIQTKKSPENMKLLGSPFPPKKSSFCGVELIFLTALAAQAAVHSRCSQLRISKPMLPWELASGSTREGGKASRPDPAGNVEKCKSYRELVLSGSRPATGNDRDLACSCLPENHLQASFFRATTT